jgi:hypothetical protein
VEVALFILGLVALVAIALFVKRWQLRRNTRAIIQYFREHGAVKEKNAKTLEEMGLTPRWQHSLVIRDTRVEALSLLLQQGLIRQVEKEGDTQKARFYFDEENYPLA